MPSRTPIVVPIGIARRPTLTIHRKTITME
jgi:hypothetical protein